MQFKIRVEIERRYRYFLVSRTFYDGIRENYDIIGRDRKITITSNRPLLRSKGLKQRTPNWQVIEGTVYFRGNLELIIAEIMKVIDA